MQIIHDGIKLNLHDREASLILELLDNYIRAGGSFRGKAKEQLGPYDLKLKEAKDNMANAMHDLLYDCLVERNERCIAYITNNNKVQS